VIRPGRAAPIVLVVAFRSDAHLAECLSRIGRPADVLVVDNGASEATREIVVGAGADYLATDANLGFAAAVNVGLEKAWDGERDVLLLNPDALIDHDGVAALQDALHAPGARRAAVGPRLVGVDGAPQRPDWPLPSPAQVWLDALGLSRLWRGPRFVVGAVLLLSGAALGELGRLDERYFLYAEEADWQLRAQRQGWTVAVVPSVTATHVGGASSTDLATRRDQLFYASAELFARRWYGTVGWTLIRVGSLLAALRRSLFGPQHARERNRRAFRLYLRGPARST
jgi:GT2 family glycosyltransferase